MFAIKNYTIEYFCLSTRPITREYFSVGNVAVKTKGYIITQRCIGCGKCMRVCPQKAVDKGNPTPYKIRSNNCLHCGNCFENCPLKVLTPLNTKLH